nr:hypothetical protein [Nitrososphaeria archaeon]
MKSFSFVQASDAHLGYMQYNLPQREADFTRAFREFVDKTKEVYPDFVVFAGDLFNDPHPSNVVLGEAISLLDSLEVPVLVVPGSHDNVYSALVGTVLDPLHKGGHIHYLPVSPFERDDVYIYGMTNFRSRRAFQEECKEYFERKPPNPSGRYNIFVLHQGVDFPELGLRPEQVEMLSGELPAGFQYYASGHMHTGKVIHYGEAVFAYSGPLETYEYDQYDRPKTFYHVEVDSDGEASIEELSIEGYRKFNVLEEDFSDATFTEIEDKGRKLVEEADDDGV